MADSKFAGIFSQPSAPAPEPQQQSGRTEKPPASQQTRPVGRPPGKRSDPAWKQFSVLLKKQTQHDAILALRTGQGEDEARDFSGLIQGLLENWLAEQRRR
jgi:hypothetical protein